MGQAHPTREILAAYAGGSLSDGMTLLVATHLTYCPACRAEVAGFEAMAGAVFESEDTDAAAPDLQATLDALDAAPAAEAVRPERDAVLPAPLRRAVGAGVEDIRWKFRMPGLHEYPMPEFEGEQVSLLRVRPGTGMLHHTHDGDEATLILTGAMEDGGTVYRAGDVALADHNDDHRPRVIGNELCYCLIVMSGHMRFTGPVGRALNLLTR